MVDGQRRGQLIRRALLALGCGRAARGRHSSGGQLSPIGRLLSAQDAHADPYADANGHRNGYSDSNCNGDPYKYPNADRNAHSHAHGHGDGHGHQHGYGNANIHGNSHRDARTDTHAHGDGLQLADIDRDGHQPANRHAHSHGDGNSHGNADTGGHSHAHSHIYGDGDGHPDSYAGAGGDSRSQLRQAGGDTERGQLVTDPNRRRPGRLARGGAAGALAAIAAAVTAGPALAQSCGTPEPGAYTTLCQTSSGAPFAIVASFSYGEILLAVLIVLLVAVAAGRLALEGYLLWRR